MTAPAEHELAHCATCPHRLGAGCGCECCAWFGQELITEIAGLISRGMIIRRSPREIAVDAILTALPHIRAHEAAAQRERIAVAIAGQKTRCPEPHHDQFPKPSCWHCARNGAFHRAARIAAGLHDAIIPGPLEGDPQ